MPLPFLAAGAALAPILIKELPSIASWIFGDKTGKAVEVVTGAARQIFGTDDPASIEAAMASDPAKLLEFKRMVLEAEGAEKERQHQELLARVADVASARAQTMELAKAGSAIAWGAPAVSLMSLGLAGAVAYLVLFPDVNQAKWTETVVTMLVGAAINWVGMVQSYWLGSSSGSAAKDATLTKVLTK